MELTTLEGLYQHPTNRLTLSETAQLLERMHGDSFCENMKLPVVMANLINSKLRQHRNHTMEIAEVYERNSGNYITKVVVRQAGETLGSIEWDVFGGKTLRLRNKAIRKKMKRKQYVSSGNQSRLSKEYDMYFKPEEQIAKAKELASNAIRYMKMAHSSQMQKQSPVVEFARSLIPYLMENVDNYKEIAIANGYDPADLEELTKVWSDLTLVESVTGKHSINGSGFFVHLEDTTCLVLNAKKEKIGAHYSHTLPDKIGGAVGMLKMTDDGTFIRNVGYKYNPRFYFIAGEYNE